MHLKEFSGPESYREFQEMGPWVETDDVGQSFLSKETTRWQGLALELPTSRSEV